MAELPALRGLGDTLLMQLAKRIQFFEDLLPGLFVHVLSPLFCLIGHIKSMLWPETNDRSCDIGQQYHNIENLIITEMTAIIKYVFLL
jgi:hypothetical protein